MVAKGFHQSEGFDFTDTFNPVVKPTTIRVVLTMALSARWPIHQLDINNAFLNEDLVEDVYLQQPPGFSSPDSTLVCKLHKAIYGLKQAPRFWFCKLSNTLISLGFHSSESDSSIFLRFTPNGTLIILIYVDDIIVTGTSSNLIDCFIAQLSDNFALKDLGKLHYFLGIEVAWLADGSLHLSQTKYI